MSELSTAIAAGLADAGYGSKSRLARACGVTPTAVGRWEKGDEGTLGTWAFRHPYATLRRFLWSWGESEPGTPSGSM